MALTNEYVDYFRVEKSFIMCFSCFIVVYFSFLCGHVCFSWFVWDHFINWTKIRTYLRFLELFSLTSFQHLVLYS